MVRLAEVAEFKRVGDGAFHLLLDGEKFPFMIEREAADVDDSVPGVSVLRIGILAQQVIGADVLNEELADERDRRRVRNADMRDLGVWRG